MARPGDRFSGPAGTGGARTGGGGGSRSRGSTATPGVNRARAYRSVATGTPDTARTRAGLDAAQRAVTSAMGREAIRAASTGASDAYNAHARAVLGDPSHPEYDAYERSRRIGEGVLNVGPAALSFIGGPAGFLAAQGFNAMTGRGIAGKLTGGVMGPVPESRFSLSGAMDWARGMFSRGGGAEAASLRQHER